MSGQPGAGIDLVHADQARVWHDEYMLSDEREEAEEAVRLRSLPHLEVQVKVVASIVDNENEARELEGKSRTSLGGAVLKAREKVDVEM